MRFFQYPVMALASVFFVLISTNAEGSTKVVYKS